MTLAGYLTNAPKAELHVHLQTTIRPTTLWELAAKNKVELPASLRRDSDQGRHFQDFEHFTQVYQVIKQTLRTTEDYERVVYELGEQYAEQGVRYAEVTFTPGPYEREHVTHSVYLAGLTRGRTRVAHDFGIELNWIFDIPRGTARRHPDLADYITEVAIEGQAEGVVALGLAGSEAGTPPAPFAPWFERARTAGLHSVPHAGEFAGPESIWGALQVLGAERIGHGVRAIEDPKLVQYLVEHRIALEICPTSNLHLGVYPSLEAHPLRRLFEAGVILTINTDIPGLIGTTLKDELFLLAEPLGMPVETIDALMLHAVQHSFMPKDRKQALETAFRSELQRLRKVDLPSE